MFWLKWTLTWRAHHRSATTLIGAIVLILIVAPLAVGLAVGTGFGYCLLPGEYAFLLLRIVLFVLYFFWLFMPLFGFALNESYDITKLFLYPISTRQIFLGMMAGSFIDLPALLTLPFFAAMLVGFARSVALGLTQVLILALFFLHTLALSQTLVLVSAAALRSRRWRDIMMILGPVLAVGWYLLTQTLPRYAHNMDWQAIIHHPAWASLNFLPPGYAAQAISAAHDGAWLPCLGWSLLLAAFTVGTVYLAGHLVTLLTIGETIHLSARSADRPSPTPPRRARATQNGVSLFERTLPPVVAAMATKEVKYLVRDPLFKVIFLNGIYLFVMMFFAFIHPWQQKDSDSVSQSLSAMLLCGFLLFNSTTCLFNIFGSEGAAAATLFLLPAPRRQMLLGKNLVHYGAFVSMNLLFLVPITLCTHTLAFLPQLCLFILLAMLVMIAVGNGISIRCPHRLVMRGWRMQTDSPSKGCGHTLIYIPSMLLLLLLLLPVVAALLVPTLWISPVWLALTIPVAIGYTVWLYVALLLRAEKALLKREIEIVDHLQAE
jgi:ABC-2 type transport system permease protein